MGTVTKSMLCLIYLRILINALPSLLCLGNFPVYISSEGVILPLHLNYICIFIDMFEHHIMASIFLCLIMLYNLIIGCTSPWEFYHISTLCVGYFSTLLLLNSHLH